MFIVEDVHSKVDCFFIPPRNDEEHTTVEVSDTTMFNSSTNAKYKNKNNNDKNERQYIKAEV
jgi:hypothetical protein